jgi:hypothetical protein
MEFVYVACLFHLAVGHVENLVRLLSCCNESVSVSVFLGPDPWSGFAVYNGGGDGSVEDSFFEVIDIVDLFIVVILLLVNPASGRGTIV